MLEIFAYAIGIMYTPGPINLLGLQSGINNRTTAHLGFFSGVATAMLILFILLGYVGIELIPAKILPVLSFAGCLYILYIAVRITKTQVNFNNQETTTKSLSFSNGLWMQLLNPKALAATLPITTIQFPAADISGMAIIVWSCILALLAFGAPASYSLAGHAIGKHMTNSKYFKIINLVMAVLLVVVAIDIALTHVLVQ